MIDPHAGGVYVGPGRRVYANDTPEYPVCPDVAVDLRYRRRGYATRLYEAMEEAGLDIETGSDTSLRFGTMTRMGYAFYGGAQIEEGK
jgi:GNAT superfamily N-acetyltransferase